MIDPLGFALENFDAIGAWRTSDETGRPVEPHTITLSGEAVDGLKGLRELVFERRITAPCAWLLGVQKLRFWHDQVFAKPPRHPGVVPWHQDYSYWTRTAPACHITLNLLLDARTLEILEKFTGDQSTVLWPLVEAELARREAE